MNLNKNASDEKTWAQSGVLYHLQVRKCTYMLVHTPVSCPAFQAELSEWHCLGMLLLPEQACLSWGAPISLRGWSREVATGCVGTVTNLLVINI